MNLTRCVTSMLPAMKRWTCVELLVALVLVAGCKNDECPAARKAASEDIVAAHDNAVALRSTRRGEVQAVQRSVELQKDNGAELESRLRHFEDMMGCVKHPDDCCAK